MPFTTFSTVWPNDDGIDVRLLNIVAMVGGGVSLMVTNTSVKSDSPTGFQ